MKESTLPTESPHSDRRENHYLNRMRHHNERFPEFDWPSVELIINLIYTYEVVNSLISRKIEKHGISPGAFNVLMILSRCRQEGMQMSELGELLLVTRSNITGLVDCLVAKDYVARAEVEHDRRVRMVSLTETGRAFLDSILPAHYGRLKAMCSGMNDNDKLELSGLLMSLRHSAQDSRVKAE
jgi:DNA-binding MarR family transcriptional regulator